MAEFESTDIPNDNVNINIQVWKSSFHISLNGNEILEMFYRVDNNVLQNIQIAGDVKQITRVDHRQIFPDIWPLQCVMENSSAKLHLHFSNDIPIKFQAGHLIVITGRCFGKALEGNFQIDLKYANNEGRMLKFLVNRRNNIVQRCNVVASNGFIEER